ARAAAPPTAITGTRHGALRAGSPGPPSVSVRPVTVLRKRPLTPSVSSPSGASCGAGGRGAAGFEGALASGALAGAGAAGRRAGGALRGDGAFALALNAPSSASRCRLTEASIA